VLRKFNLNELLVRNSMAQCIVIVIFPRRTIGKWLATLCKEGIPSTVA